MQIKLGKIHQSWNYSLIIYPNVVLKSVWLSLFCGTQKKILNKGFFFYESQWALQLFRPNILQNIFICVLQKKKQKHEGEQIIM